MPKVGDVIADKYTIEQLIGLGGMGAVFAATHKFTGKRVALKWMLPELAQDVDAVQRFMREAHAAGRINHPNVVDVYDVGQHEDSYFLVMEYLHGEPLTSALARRDMSSSDLLQLLLPAMRGVAAAHRQGVVHRDLKPDNIFLAYEEDGSRRECKVLDFGISKLSNEGVVNPRLTKTGAVVGTPYYMSPEQIRGSDQLDKRADVYAFGVILYEALTGQVPFHADTYGALVLEIATGTPKTPRELVPSLPSELSRVVLRAMSRDAPLRYPDMESLIRALEPFALPAGVGSQPRPPSGRHAARLDATRLSEPHAPQVATLPQLASTPFASEVPEARRRLPLGGPLLFVAAAFAIVGGVWLATRAPEPAPMGPVVMPAPLDSASVAPPAASPVRPAVPVVTAAPIAPVVIAVPAASAKQTSTSTTPDRGTLHDRDALETETETERTERGSRGKYSTRRRGGQRSAAQPEPDSPPVAPPASQPGRKARSGTLSANEF
jgi:serine/threonine-protein kinase